MTGAPLPGWSSSPEDSAPARPFISAAMHHDLVNHGWSRSVEGGLVIARKGWVPPADDTAAGRDFTAAFLTGFVWDPVTGAITRRNYVTTGRTGSGKPDLGPTDLDNFITF